MCFQHQRIRSSSFSFCFSHSLKQLIYQTSTLTLGPSTAPALRGPGLPTGTVTVLYKLYPTFICMYQYQYIICRSNTTPVLALRN